MKTKKNNRLIVLIIILIIMFFAVVIEKFLPLTLTKLGKSAFYKKDYVQAFYLLKFANNIDNKNKDLRYHYVKTLINLKPTLEVQKELFKVAELDLADSADLIADKKIETWRNQIFFNVGQNYIEQVPLENKIVRWDKRKFPLQVFIEKNSNTKAPQYYQENIKKAFLQWQTSTSNFIRFSFTPDEKQAQIVVKFAPQSTLNCEGEDCKYVIAYTTPEINGDILEKMDLTFYDTNNLSQPFTQREIYNTALHEIGHALGIMGHSYNKDDLMYMQGDVDRIFDEYRSEFQLISPNDLNTLNLLYKLTPDISNTHLSGFDTSKQFYAPIVMGTTSQITSRKMLEAQNYIQAAPNLPNGYIDLAAALAEQKKYNDAIRTLNQALSLCSNDNERFLIYYNIAVVYANVQTWEEALKYIQMAKNINPDADTDGLVASIYFSMGNTAEAKKYFLTNLKNHPENTIDAINLARLYLREFNLVQAGKTINKLINSNPEAASDPRVKSFAILTFLFK